MSKTLLRLSLQSQGIPVISVAGSEPPYTIGYDESATPEQIAAGDAIALAYTEPSEPDREAFRIGIISDPGVLRVLSSDPVRAALLINTLDNALNGKAPLLTSVKTLWDAMAEALDPPMTAAEIAAANAIASTHNIPGFSLAADGTMVLG